MPESSFFADASSTHICAVCGERRYLVQLTLRGKPSQQVCTVCCGDLLRQSEAASALASTKPPTGLAILQELGRLLVVWGVTDWLLIQLDSVWGQGELVPLCRIQLEFKKAIALLATVEPPNFATCWPPVGVRKSPSWEWRWKGRVLGADLELVAVESEPLLGASALSSASLLGLSQPPPNGAAGDSAEDVEDTMSVDEEGARP